MQFRRAIVASVGIFALCLGAMLAVVLAFEAAARLENPVRISANSYLGFDNWDDGHVSAGGTLVFTDDQQGFPVQTTKLYCIREQTACTAATAMIMSGTMALDMNFLRVTSWNSETISAIDDSPICVFYEYVFSRTAKRVVATRRSKPSRGDVCSDVSTNSLRMDLVDGSRVSSALNSAAHEKYRPFLWLAWAAIWVSGLAATVQQFRRARAAS